MTSVPDIFSTMAYGPAPEAVAPAHAWLERHQGRFGLFIGGAWTQPGDETFETQNPASGKPLARLTQAGEADVDRAVGAAPAPQATRWGGGGPQRPPPI
jgi:aldehyde dehydrogenase (NAD+)